VSWRIPPIGWCVTCLVARKEERPAQGLFNGNGLCVEHLEMVLAGDLADLVGEGDQTS